MPAKAWKLDDAKQPKFPSDFEVVRKVILQLTDLSKNNNKYYSIEQHQGQLQGRLKHRVFTHYGRTDDLEVNPKAGTKECRYFDTSEEAAAEYQKLLKAKTGPKKGYQEVALASATIGTGQGNGHTSSKVASPSRPAAKPSSLPPAVQELVRTLYAEATGALTQTVAATITASGIQTPLGALTLAQIAKGEAILQRIHQLLTGGSASAEELRQASGEFYSAIPHRIGRSKEAVIAATIDSLAEFNSRQETLQLMKDMLSINGEQGSVLFDAHVDRQYQALGCELTEVSRDADEYRTLEEAVLSSQVAHRNIKVKGIFRLRRAAEHAAFRGDIGNQRRLFHGSRISNWLGIVSRGILMPKVAVSSGVNRTDAGWLGNGIYFGSAACTAAFYATPGSRNTRLMAMAQVALGEVKEYTKITYGLNAPPPGYQSTRGVRRSPTVKSQFDDDEYVIYDPAQHVLQHLVEFTV